MYDTLILSLACLCVQFCDTDEFLAFRQVNKYWLKTVFSNKAALKHFQLNAKWQRHACFRIQQLVTTNNSNLWTQLRTLNYTLIARSDVYYLKLFPNLHTLNLVLWRNTISFNFEPGDTLPSSLQNLYLNMLYIDQVSALSLTHNSEHLKSLTFVLTCVVNNFHCRILHSLVAQTPKLKSFSLLFDATTTNFDPKNFINLIAQLPELSYLMINRQFKAEDCISILSAVPATCSVELCPPNNGIDWYRDLYKYFLINPNFQANKLKLHGKLTGNNYFHVLACGEKYLRQIVVNRTKKLCTFELQSLKVWKLLGKCTLVNEVDLYFDEPLLLMPEHLQRLLPICKQYHYFRLTNVKMSFRTCDLVREWIHENMPRLQHAESLINITLIAESEEKLLIESHAFWND
jgi:hypothetical protein